MPLIKEANAEPIPGYRLIEPLGRGGFGEVWKCEAPGGLFKAIKFVEGDGHGPPTVGVAAAEEELKAIQRVKALRHPFLLSMERVEVISGELVIVMELADHSLLDLLNKRRAAGHAGIERAELLRYLREAADVLDVMNRDLGLQHLDVKPGNLFLVSGHVKVADFGLVRNLGERNGSSAGDSLGAISPRYAAPELFRSAISPFSDQYSLAIVFQELLTGTVPFNGKNARQLALQHSHLTPNLRALPQDDRGPISRALSKEPVRRFPSCTDLIDALAGTSAPPAAETVRNEGGPEAAADTKRDFPVDGTAPMQEEPAAGPPEYELLRCLSRSPFAEVWEGQTGDGRRWLVKYLYGVTGKDPGREREAAARLEAVSHPALTSLQFVPGGPGYLVVVTEQIEETLRDHFQKCRGSGGRGVPRRQLLGWLRGVAEALDELAERHNLSHLGLHPRNLLVHGDRLRLADFGLIPLLWQPAGQLKSQVQARYAAPELLDREATGPRCDQYSLAVIYQEMLTGTHPLHGRVSDRLNLAALPDADRPLVARALNDNPDARFPRCTAFIQALEEAGAERRAADGSATPTGTPTVSGPGAILAELVAHASEVMPVPEPETWLTTPGGIVLQGRFAASLPPGGARATFEGFRRQWNGEVLQSDDTCLVIQVGLPARFWQRWLGRSPVLMVEIRWTRVRPPAVSLPEITVSIRAADNSGKAGAALVKEAGPPLLDSIRGQIQGYPNRRSQERLFWAHPARASFVLANGERSGEVECQIKDVSLAGMGLYLPCTVPGTMIHLDLRTACRSEPIALDGTCVRVQRCGDGWYEAGVLFQ